MRVSEAMTRDVRLANPSETIRQASQMMTEIDAGVLPVGENDRLVGMITDRDIAVRAVAAGKSSDTPIRDIMSRDVCYCFDDQEIRDVAANMAEIQVRRMPVLSRDKRLVGILSLADMARAESEDEPAMEALSGICERGGQHSQSSGGPTEMGGKPRPAKARQRKVDDAVEMTFPASDPTAPGHATGTEPASRPADRRAPRVTKEDIERAATKRK